MLEYIDKQEELEESLELESSPESEYSSVVKGMNLWSSIVQFFDNAKENVNFFISEITIDNSPFAEKCGHILPPKLERISSRFAVGVFADKINSDIREKLHGANFMNATGLEANQFQEIACPSPLSKSLTMRYVPT